MQQTSITLFFQTFEIYNHDIPKYTTHPTSRNLQGIKEAGLER